MNKNNIRKGNVFYANLDPIIGSEQNGIRPVVIIQNNLGNKYSPTVVVAPITSIIKKEKLPTHIIITTPNIMQNKSMILLEQIRTIDKKRLMESIGTLDDKDLDLINKKLSNIFKS